MMSWLARATTSHGHSRQRRGARRQPVVERSTAPTIFDCERFEYLPAGDAALVRLAGHWRTTDQPSADALKLIVDGPHARMIGPLPDPLGKPSNGTCRAAFSVPLSVLQHGQ